MKNLVIFVLLLAACAPAARPSATPIPTAVPRLANTPVPSPSATASPAPGPTITRTPVPRQSPTTGPTDTPTLTSTPVPPLVAHEWSQSEPLVIFGYSRGRGTPGDFRWGLPADFTLLPSGDLYLLRPINDHTYALLTTTLERQATCYLLNSIDQAGFFDYDPESYGHHLTTTDSRRTSISVHAWRANSVSLDAFVGTLEEVTKYELKSGHPAVWPIILPAIRHTYKLLDEYKVPPGALQALKPERLGVWIYAAEWPARVNGYVKWPLRSHSLAAEGQLPKLWYGGDPMTMILTGEDATRVYDALGATLAMDGTTVLEGNKQYQVFARPLLPNELVSLGVWVLTVPGPAGTRHYAEWPLTSPRLLNSLKREPVIDAPSMILRGEEAVQVFNALGEGGGTVREGDQLYHVAREWLLPGRPHSVPLPKVTLSCSPSDGWMQAP